MAEPAVPVESLNRSVLVLYGSETGNSQDVAEELGRSAQRLHFRTAVEELDAIKLSALVRYELVIFVVGTAGQGDMPRNASAFWKSILRKKLPPTCLSRMKFTTFGLGDSTYPKFNWAIRLLHKRLEQLGGVEFYPRGEADEQDDEGVDGAYLPWSAGLRNYLLSTFPLPRDSAPIPEDALLPANYTLKLAGSNLSTLPQSRSIEGLPPNLALPIPNRVEVTLVENQRVTPAEPRQQDVRHIKFDILASDLHVNPGDCLSIYPKNFPADAEKLIQLMNWEAVADLPLHISNNEGTETLPRGLYPLPSTTLRDLLLHNLDITAVPRRSFLKALCHFAADPEHRKRLLEFSLPEYTDEFYDYTTRPRRTMLEVLEEFHSVRIPLDRVLDTFPVMRGRDFSIANGGRSLLGPLSVEDASSADVLEDGTAMGGGSKAAKRVEILVALVKFRNVMRKPREGLCSRYLTNLEPGTRMVVTHKPTTTKLYGPAQARRPLLAIGTGTGVAPIRALIHERLTHLSVLPSSNIDVSSPPQGLPSSPSPTPHSPDTFLSTANDASITTATAAEEHESQTISSMALFFGNRRRNADYFFQREWASLPLAAHLVVHPAFSRDQVNKIYVQDRLREETNLVAEMVRRDAIFLVCGGSTKMAESCKAAVMHAMRVSGVVTLPRSAAVDECGKESKRDSRGGGGDEAQGDEAEDKEARMDEDKEALDEALRAAFNKLTWWQEIW